jgi:uncharacterized repeat protein (TIGR03843 family)
MPEDERTPAASHLRLLAEGEVELRGRMPWSSNHTFLVSCTLEGEECQAVYKPMAGERPLWDFDQGLGRREAAAYQLSELLGWELVPETVWREDAPLGPGSLQRFVEADYSEHYFTLLEDPSHHELLRRIAVFDVVANNADRKSGHCLLGTDGRIWAIDNGLCFHRHAKLRTVIWDFAGEPLPAREAEDLSRLVSEGTKPTRRLVERLGPLIDQTEMRALESRTCGLIEAGYLPEPDPDSHYYPWPLV